MTNSYSGERYDPGAANALAFYDHHARYRFVSQLAGQGLRLLDVGCGLGVGARTLRESFDTVVAIDASVDAITEARRRHQGVVGLTFETIDGFVKAGLPRFDVITCLEVIEHTLQQRELLQLLKKHLAPDGVVVVSTPNRRWTEARKLVNPFHVKELLHDEFFSLVRAEFPVVEEWSQLQTQGAAIVRTAAEQPSTFHATPRGQAWGDAEVTNFVAVAALTAPAALQGVSLLDAQCTFQGELEEVIRSEEKMIDERVELLRQQELTISELLHERNRLRGQVDRLRRLEDMPDSDAVPLRWKLADAVNASIKKTPIHTVLKKLLTR